MLKYTKIRALHWTKSCEIYTSSFYARIRPQHNDKEYLIIVLNETRYCKYLFKLIHSSEINEDGSIFSRFFF